MKRFIVMICLLLMLSVSAYAEWELPIVDEAFSIRNGISFGMSRDDVISVEETNGNAPTSNNEKCLEYKNIDFLGKNSAWLSHHFTKDNKLSSFAYTRMGSMTSNNYYIFSDVYKALKDKYGEPMLTKELSPIGTAIWSDIPYDIFYMGKHLSNWSADTLYGGAGSRDGSMAITNYAMWLVKYSDCAIVIELAETDRGDYLSLGYAGITHTDLESWLGYRQQIIEETEKSYSNDI